MQKQNENLPRYAPGGRPPYAAQSPLPRCFARVVDARRPFCGEIASYARPGPHWFSTEYFCDLHRLATDEPIAAIHVYRRVRVSLDVLLAGVHVNAPIAHVEAITALELAVKTVGAVLDIAGVRSEMVSSPPPPPAGTGFARRGVVG